MKDRFWVKYHFKIHKISLICGLNCSIPVINALACNSSSSGDIHSPHQHPKSCLWVSGNNHHPAAGHQGGDAGERSVPAQSSVWVWMLWGELSHGWVLLNNANTVYGLSWRRLFCLYKPFYLQHLHKNPLVSTIRLLKAKIQKAARNSFKTGCLIRKKQVL